LDSVHRANIHVGLLNLLSPEVFFRSQNGTKTLVVGVLPPSWIKGRGWEVKGIRRDEEKGEAENRKGGREIE